MRDLQKDLEVALNVPKNMRIVDTGKDVEVIGICDQSEEARKHVADWFFHAKQCWPEAIKRAMAAEARVKELETVLKIMEKQLEIAAREITKAHEEYDMCPSDYDGELTCVCEGTIADVWRCWRERWKRKALAALEGGIDQCVI